MVVHFAVHLHLVVHKHLQDWWASWRSTWWSTSTGGPLDKKGSELIQLRTLKKEGSFLNDTRNIAMKVEMSNKTIKGEEMWTGTWPTIQWKLKLWMQNATLNIWRIRKDRNKRP